MGGLASLATQVCWGPRCHSSPLAHASEGLCWSCSRALPSPASCAGGRGDHRVAKSKPECLGVCRKQLGPEQGPRRGLPAPFLRLPSCPRGSWCLRSWKPGLGFGVRQPPRLVPGSTGWGGRRKALPPHWCVPGRPHAGRVLKRGAQLTSLATGLCACLASVLKAPVSCGAPGNPMCWVRQASPSCPPPSLAGPAHPGPPTACMQDSDPTPTQPCLEHRAGSAPE